MGFADLKARYSTSEAVTTSDLPAGTEYVLCRTAFGLSCRAELENGTAILTDLPRGTHVLEAWSPDGELLGEEYTNVTEHPGDGPVVAFATSFQPGNVDGVLSWLGSLRCTVVQFYDWMERYSAPWPTSEHYRDPLGRELSRSALERLVAGVKRLGAVAQAYAPVCAAEPAFAEANSRWLLYRSDGEAQHLGDLLQIMDPASTAWQEHWLTAYLGAAEAIGFDGFHLDTYGYPRRPLDATGAPRSMEAAYEAFVGRVRAAAPSTTLSFNQVDGVPSGFDGPSRPAFRYVEVWPPNDLWRHFEGLMARSSGANAWAGGVLAAYPPVWDGERESALRTVVLTEAITTCVGAGLLVLGDDAGALCDPYYPNHEHLRTSERDRTLSWHRFALRCRDLFRDGEDTSWSDIGDEHGEVQVEAQGVRVSPEPLAGAVLARVVRHGSTTTVSCVDLTGSRTGSWLTPTGKGNLQQVRVRMLVARPDRCRAAVAVLGADGGRFQEAKIAVTGHGEGRAVEVRLPIVEGWSVARFDESADGL